MKAMVLNEICEIEVEGKTRRIQKLPFKAAPLEMTDVPVPHPGPGDIVIKISYCGICHTELDQIEGRIAPPKIPVIPGHQPVGTVSDAGKAVSRFKIGDRVGAAWIYSCCGVCKFCRNGLENLCPQFKGTGCNENGGYAEYMLIDENFAYRIPDGLMELSAVAPLMCSGIIGFRSLKLTGMKNGKNLGLVGFGSSNHLVIQVANFLYPDSKKFVISRNPMERELAKKLGAYWTGDIEDKPPEKFDCAIDTTPVWKPFVFGLENLERGGRMVINLIRKEETDKQEYLSKIDYPRHLWLEKEIKTVANITRKDATEFLELASRIQLKPELTSYELDDANKALTELKKGKSSGSKILKIS